MVAATVGRARQEASQTEGGVSAKALGLAYSSWKVRHSQARVTAPPPPPQGGSQVHHHLSTSLPVLLNSCRGSPEQKPQVWATSVSHAGPRAVEGGESGRGGQREHGQHGPAAKAGALALILR